MKELLFEIIKAGIIGFSIIIGMLLCLGYLLNKAQKIKYRPDDLLPAFKEYLKKVEVEEWYEQRAEVQHIIDMLSNGILTPAIEKYQIKKELLIHTDSHGEGSTFKFENKYTVIELKPIYDQTR
jgi:hypothetical protein